MLFLQSMPQPWILFLWICPACGYVLPGLRGALAVEGPSHGQLGAKDLVRMLQEAAAAKGIPENWPDSQLDIASAKLVIELEPHSSLERVGHAGGGLLQGPSQATSLKVERRQASMDRCCPILAKGLGLIAVGHTLRCSGHQVGDALDPRKPT